MEDRINQLRSQSNEHYEAEKELRKELANLHESISLCQQRTFGDGNGNASLARTIGEQGSRIVTIEKYIQAEIVRREILEATDRKDRSTRQAIVDSREKRRNFTLGIIGVLIAAAALVPQMVM